MNPADRCRVSIEVLLNLGLPPTPTNVNRALGREGRVKMNMLNGRETKIRREVLEAAGWTLGPTRRWSPPE